MSALERWQTAIAGNLASGSVAGFKKDETTFSSVATGQTSLDPMNGSAVFKRSVPQATTRLHEGQGTLRQTGKDLDFAIQGPGYFQVRTADGGTGYTRNGEFHLDANGKLVNGQGNDVMGEGGPLTIDVKLGPVSVNAAGQIIQGENTVGKIGVFDLSQSGSLKRTGDGLLVPSEDSRPGPVEAPQISQGYVEESNVSPLQEMVNLITVSRAYEVSQKLITTMDQLTHSAIESLGTP